MAEEIPDFTIIIDDRKYICTAVAQRDYCRRYESELHALTAGEQEHVKEQLTNYLSKKGVRDLLFKFETVSGETRIRRISFRKTSVTEHESLVRDSESGLETAMEEKENVDDDFFQDYARRKR